MKISANVISYKSEIFLYKIESQRVAAAYICIVNKNELYMKARSLFLAALVTVVSLATAVGKDVPRNTGLAVVPVKGSEVFKVIYKGETTGRVKLNIYNASSRIIFSESINVGDGFICPLNFAGLEPGEYTLELVDVTGAKKVKK